MDENKLSLAVLGYCILSIIVIAIVVLGSMDRKPKDKEFPKPIVDGGLPSLAEEDYKDFHNTEVF